MNMKMFGILRGTCYRETIEKTQINGELSIETQRCPFLIAIKEKLAPNGHVKIDELIPSAE
jgi:hypothetical protein